MHVLALLGSRNPEGRTAVAVQALLDGVATTAPDARIEKVFLPHLNLERCRQCNDSGWGKCRSEGACVIDDDIAPLIKKILAADLVVFATPVYFGDLSESMRVFLDRLRRVLRHSTPADLTVAAAIGICVAGGGGGGAPAALLALEKILQTCRFDIWDMVPARRQNLALKREVLSTTGRWAAECLTCSAAESGAV